ncbi:uncharacterized protein LOC124642855 [Helicoverpa zea]|uniref:uncharacterized protein LOC124642855 n=1 Tax=Helicoverpa zea TaxID=7113 RepID=UPI001F584E59|nr:uncharacterized protein LOC124642855 [Helicoverpa zea]
MSIIAVKCIPQKWNLGYVVKMFSKVINGRFEALNFQSKSRTQKSKTCYLRLSDKLDPVQVVENINSAVYPYQFKPMALIPDHVPDIPLAAKPKKVPQKLRKSLKLKADDTPDKVITITKFEIIAEMQAKYPGLYDLSRKTNHTLLEDIAKKVHERIQVIGENNPETLESCFKLSQHYRRAHPHFGDFQLVLSTLHAHEDRTNQPRTQLLEEELAAVKHNKHTIDTLPHEQVQKVVYKYSDRIIKKVTEHVNNLKSEVMEGDTEDEIVRKKVREELKKMAPFLPLIVKQVVTKHFVPQRTGYQRMRIYGEPFLPSKETMAPFVRRYQPVRVNRSERVYNLLRFYVPPAHVASLLAMDGTVLNGAKLIIRTCDLPAYKVSAALAGTEGAGLHEDNIEEENEDWSDMMQV